MLKRVSNDLGNIKDLRSTINFVARVFKHPRAKRAANRQDISAARCRFLEAFDVHLAITMLLFFPKLSATRPTAKRIRTIARHLYQWHSACSQHLARRVKYIIVPAEIAWIMESHIAPIGRARSSR